MTQHTETVGPVSPQYINFTGPYEVVDTPEEADTRIEELLSENRHLPTYIQVFPNEDSEFVGFIAWKIITLATPGAI